MRSSELVSCSVLDADGSSVGRVHDLQFRLVERDGARRYELSALQCGPAALGHRLGYGRPQMRGPAFVSRFFRFLSRHSVVVDWKDVTSLERPIIRVARKSSELPPAHAAHA
jgi:sporulation protein YlmC with PRC-barrel domain